MASKYDWYTYEPRGRFTEYGGVEDSVAFVLAPVKAWSSRLKMELEAEMDKTRAAGLYSWKRFVGDGPEHGHVTLVRQAAELAVYGAPPEDLFTSPISDPFDYGPDREFPFMITDPKIVSQALDWLWFAFSCRIDDRARHASAEEGSHGLTKLCELLASRFDVVSQWTPYRGGYFSKEEAEAARSLNRGIDSALSFMRASAERLDYELWPVMERGSRNGDTSGDWNGWKEEAWLRFVGTIDETRTRFADLAREVDAEMAAEAEEMYRLMYPHPSPPPRPATTQSSRVGLGGYHAPAYADRLIEAFEAAPEHFLRRGRFKPLRDAANLSERQERTVKEQIGYTGENARGFQHFLRLLYEAQGRTAPIPLPES